ncbi:LacI family transcriptional regulator [Schnuerera sp. xch1]|uniref:LacI family DNA-binding transcriptional regulator n=1 Tax=Schnuerera sp. xch1 TaxID=2874283 RepID=UPI001CBFDB96|nr:LacI family DNA-binding transcriptional regulator [Schnuerera sp. xch1]MBZ2175876.1 LacI family transcriptional regulator [Schnuerera sp. xch1]
MSVTIKDIAKSLGISYSSVSRALNNKPGVSSETRKRVIDEAKKMGYKPNDMARGLVKKQTNTIGVIIPDIANSFFGEVTEGIIETANENGYTVFLCITNWNMEIEKEYLRTLQQKRVDGIILKSSKDQEERRYKDEINVPYILLEGRPAYGNSFVGVNNKRGSYIGTKYLLKQGYRNIAFAGGSKDSYTNMQRVQGYIHALKERAIPIDKELILYNDFTAKGGYILAEELLNNDKNIDAIFAGNDVIALGVLDYATTHDFSIPEELGVLGFDDIFYAELPQIQLTTIHQPKYELGKYALEILIDDIHAGEDRTCKSIILEPKLVVRNTTR